MDISVKGKIALVTASTRGIGHACAEKLAKSGAKVYFAVRRLDAGQKLVDEIKAKGGQAGLCYFDATKPATYSSCIDEVVQKEGRLDILVNNFGFTDVKVDFDVVNTPLAEFQRIVSENLAVVYQLSQTAIKAMQKTGGSIINIASVGGRYPDMYRTAYGVAKAAILFLSQDIAVQYAHNHVRCNCILPGLIETDAAMKKMSPEFLHTFLKTVPLARMGQVDDIANTCLFLASDASSYITGEQIEVAGGFGKPSPMFSHYGQMQGKG